MAKGDGTTQYWTEDQEKYYERLMAGCRDQATRNIIIMVRDLIKYDHRTKQGRRATAQSRLRIATATDEELAEMARVEVGLAGSNDTRRINLKLVYLKRLRQSIRERGINKEEITV